MGDLRILIIDDEVFIRRALADYLTEYGYETVTAADGVEGLEQARGGHFDLVLVDLRMPRMDGLQVIATLHAEQPQQPLVVVSGTGVLSDVVEAMRHGAWDYVTKPVRDMHEIVVVCERVLERSRLISERDRYQLELEHLNRSLESEVARQTRDLLAQNRELMALNRVSYAISGTLDLGALLDRAVGAAVSALDADGGMVRLLNPATGALVMAAACGLPASYLESARAIRLGDGLIGQVAQSGHPSASRNLSGDRWLGLLAGAGFGAYVCVPLRAGEEMTPLSAAPLSSAPLSSAPLSDVPLSDAPPGDALPGNAPLASPPFEKKHLIVGTLGVATRSEREFSAHQVELLSAIANQIGVAVARAQYAADLELANAELRRLDTLREQFIQNVAHELRTPLAMVQGYIEVLVQEDLTPGEQRTAVNVAFRHVRKLVDLVEAITTLQDLSSQPLQKEKVDLLTLLQTACQMATQRAATADVTLDYECPPDLPLICGDFTRLAQALHQLLDNACKFSPKGSTVTIRVGMADKVVWISVSDQGIGIPPQEHRRIFERFYQVDGSTTRRYGGTGLGLALAMEIVEAHSGKIRVESPAVDGEGMRSSGLGATFIVTLPVLEGQHAC